MPIIKSAKKAMRQTKKRTEENKSAKADIKKALKEALAAIDSNTKDIAEKIIIAQKKLDKASKKNIFHPNKVARKLSRLVKKIKPTKK